MKRTVLVFVLSFFSFVSYAGVVELAQGVDIHSVNGEKIKNAEDIQLVNGQNQLVLSFGGKLIESGKKEHYSAPPYVVVATLDSSAKTKIKLNSKRLSTITKNVKSGSDIFEITQKGEDVSTTQEILPPADTFLPYSNIEKLVKEYNQERGLIFESGTIRELQKELEQVQTTLVTEVKTKAESEASLQLKIWYSRATEEERKEFQRWMIEQK